MTSSPSRAHSVLIAALLVGGCTADSGPGEDPGFGSDALRITEPTPGALFAGYTVHVVGTAEVEGSADVVINGQSFPVTGGRFEGDVDMVEGPGRITATRDGHEAWVDIMIDTLPPAIVIESPTVGSFVEGESLRVRGRVNDATFESLHAGETFIQVAEDGTFDAELPLGVGAHRVRFVATDRIGHEGTAFTAALVGHFEPEETLQPNALVIELGNEALTTLGGAVTPYLRPAQLEPLLLAANPVTSGWWGRLDVDSETHGEPSLVLTPRENQMDVLVTIPSVVVPLTADLAVGSLTGVATADRAILRASATLSVDGGRPVVTLTSVEVTLEGLLIDVHGLWSWIDANIVTTAARGMIESRLVMLVQEQVPLRLEEALAGIDDLRSVEVASGRAALGTELSELSVTRTGIRATMDMAITPTAPIPALAERSPGVLVARPAAPERSGHPGVYAAVSTDLLNSALHTTWLNGLLEQRFDNIIFQSTGEAVTLRTLAGFVPSLIDAAPPDSTLVIDLESALPPIASEPQAGIVGADAADVRIRIYARLADGELVPLLVLSAGVHAEIRATLDDSTISIEFISFDITGDVIEGPSDTPTGADLDLIITELVSAKVMELVRFDGVPLPTFAGFSLESPDAYSRDGYLRFEAELVSAPY